jgi:hypothetical protein
MPQAPSDRGGASTDLLLGELIAEIRAVKHNQANSSQKLDAVTLIAANQTEILHRMEKFEKEQERQGFRLGVLEADKNRREGAIGLVAWVSRNWPFTVLLAIVAAVIAWANGKVTV